MKRRLQHFALLIVLLLPGCSATRLAYDHADWLLLAELDDYLDLDSAQHERLARELETFLEAHRREQLPAIERLLTTAAARVRGPIAEPEAKEILDRAEKLVKFTVKSLTRAVAPVLTGLTTEQRQRLERKLAEREREFAERNHVDKNARERLRLRVEKTIEAIEKWTGELTSEQKQAVRRIRNAMPDSSASWLAFSRSKHQALLALIDTGPGPETLLAFFEGWIDRLEGASPALLRARSGIRQGVRSMIVELSASLSDRQREHLVKRLTSYGNDFRALQRS